MLSSVMAAIDVIILLLLTIATTGSAVASLLDISPCRTDNDTVYGGVRVNCQHQNISVLPLPEQWIPASITTLLLDYNSITQLNNQSFMNLATHSTLRSLSLSHNRIAVIEPCTFSGLDALQKLDLSSNNIDLDRKYLSAKAFQGLEELLELHLVDMNEEREGQYPGELFYDLQNLHTLTLETFIGVLNFGSLFNHTKKLSSLVLTGGVRIITNNSFECFEGIKLKQLQFLGVQNLYIIEAGAFSYLKYLDGFTLTGSHQNLTMTMESLAPFVNRNMSFLRLNSLTRNYKIPQVLKDNTILTRHMARYLSKICVETLELIQDTIFLIEIGVLTSPTFRRCLKSLDLSNNPLSGEVVELYLIFSQNHNLEDLKIANRKYAWVSHPHSKLWQPPVCMGDVKHSSKYTTLEYDNNATKSDLGQNHLVWINDEIFTRTPINSPSANQVTETYLTEEFTPGLQSQVFNLPIPRKLKTLIFQSQSNDMMSLEKIWQIRNGLRLEEIYLSDNGIQKFTGSIKGLTNLKVVDLSMNDGSTFSERFFDPMPSIVHLNMAKMNLDTNFMVLFSDRLFSILTNLSTLDLSYNELHFMATGTFAANEKLSVLSLAGNRFQNIPFDLNLVPKLCSLDLRKNSFRMLSERDMSRLEQQARNMEGFTLRLDGNEFHCGCDSLRFLSWLQRSHINFDMNRNYSCTTDSGIRTSTGKMNDLEAMWRMCVGEKALSLSLILSCLMVLGFICAIVIPQFKTQLKVFILRSIWNPFLMKTADDYPIGVFIGYADQDRKLACQRLRPYIETQLRLSTYVRHRDLLPASDIAESMMEAVHSSWRVLLLISDHFINDPWSYFLLKASTHAVQPDNPGRLILFLIDDDPQSASTMLTLPSCVLQAVHEENIITMTSNGNISYEDKQALKTALVHYRKVT